MARIAMEMPDDQAEALAQLCKRFTFADADRRSDDARERHDMIEGIGTLRRALAAAGFAPQ
jgi:hypothetical protein